VWQSCKVSKYLADCHTSKAVSTCKQGAKLQYCLNVTKVTVVETRLRNAYLSTSPLYIFTGKVLKNHSGPDHYYGLQRDSGPQCHPSLFWFWLAVTRRQHSTRLRKQAAVWWKFSSSALHCLEVSHAEATAKLIIFSLILTLVLHYLFQIQIYSVNTTEVDSYLT
jgi:hypothetical protein